MATIGYDCQVILDGVGYFIEPGSYVLTRPRVRRAQLSRGSASGHLGVPERYVDRGPSKREWRMALQCYNTLKRYDGTQMGDVGQALRDAVHQSYEKVATALTFVDPSGTSWSVYFDDLEERIADLREQTGTIGYLLAVTLVEA
jgi:hypothetical protein